LEPNQPLARQDHVRYAAISALLPAMVPASGVAQWIGVRVAAPISPLPYRWNAPFR